MTDPAPRDDDTFDQYANDYAALHKKNLGFLGRNMSVFAEYKIKIARSTAPSTVRSILDFGCGVGGNLGPMRRLFPDCRLLGCDTSAESLTAAQRDYPNVELARIAEPEALADWAEDVDMVFVSNVFHHIPPDQRSAWAKALRRIAGQGLLMFEHNPWNPVTRHLVNTCPFDEDAVLLKRKDTRKLLTEAGFTIRRFKYTLLTPLRLAPLVWIEKALAAAPLGGQYYVWATP